jgi:hypothetical protein
MTANVNADMPADSGELCDAVLTAMGAAGWVKQLPHGRLAYESHESVLCVAIDNCAIDDNRELVDISPTWGAICRYVEAAGFSAHRLEIPGNRELADALESGEFADIAAPGLVIYIPEASVLGRQWGNGVLSWRLETPGAPWVPEEGDAYLIPESPEVAAHALASDPDFIAAVALLKSGQN